MSIITSAEVKSLLQITVSTYDTLIATLIPMAQDRIVEYCQNSFLDSGIALESDGIAFVSGSPATITDSNSGFSDAGFESGHDCLVQGSTSNDGIYAIQTVADGTLTLVTAEVLTTEAVGDVILTRVRWPKGIKLDAAQLVNYYLHREGKLVKREDLPGGYSADFLSESDVMKFFNKYRKPYR